jgi:hypothetical protein
VFSNLLQNVGRHAAGALVPIDLRRVGGEARIRVSDGGSENQLENSSCAAPSHLHEGEEGKGRGRRREVDRRRSPV